VVLSAMRNPIRHTKTSDPSFTPAPPDPLDILGIVRRGWPIWGLFLLLGAAAGAGMLASMPPSYKANVRLVLESSGNRYLQSNKVTHGPALGDESWAQLHIVTSEAVLLPVIKKLNLMEDPEIGVAPPGQQDDSPVRKLRSGIRGIASGLGIQAAKPTDDQPNETAVYKAMFERLFVTWEAQPAVMNVSFESKDPAKAALIANEVAASYINYTIESKRALARIAARALQDRLAELRTQAATAERELLEYKISNNILSSDPNPATGDKTNSMGSHIESARLAVLEARGRWEGVQLNDGTDSWASYIPDNSLLSRLREQYIEVETRALDMESRVGTAHAASRKIRKRLAEISAVMAAERRRIASTFAVELKFAKARFDELRSAASVVMSQESTNSDVTARARELESSAAMLRALYGSLLKHVSEDNKLDNDQLVLPDARILSRATPPTRTESSKKRLFVLASGTSLGLLFGAALLFGRGSPIGVFRSPRQVKASLGLMPVILPKVRRRSRSRAAPLGDIALQMPYSRFAEGIRLIWTLISSGRRERPVQVVGVISALAGEGKTTIATNLANQVGMHAELRTLLIDADLHQQTLTRSVAAGATVGLKEALDQPAKLGEYVTRMDGSGVHVLPCPYGARLPNAAQLLGSRKMEELIQEAKRSYDLIIIEAPPISPLTDFRMLYPLCDGFVYVVEWGKTSQQLVLETFSEQPGLWERVLCVVLNKADEGALKSIDAYKGKDYHSYFQ